MLVLVDPPSPRPFEHNRSTSYFVYCHSSTTLLCPIKCQGPFYACTNARSTADFCSSSASTIRALELLLRHCHVLPSATTHHLPRRVISSITAQRSPSPCPLERDRSSLPVIVPSQAQLFLFHLCHILSSVSIPCLFLVPTVFSRTRMQAPPPGPTMTMQQS